MSYENIARNSITNANRAAPNASGKDIVTAATVNRFSISLLPTIGGIRDLVYDSGDRLCDHLHHVADFYDFKQLLHVGFAHSDTSVRNILPYRTLIVGPVDAVALVA